MAKRNKKERVGVVYSTNQSFDYDFDEDQNEETLPANEQTLYVWIDKSGRKGKVATLVKNFVGSEDDLKDLGKLLKQKCGVGGSAKDGEIIIQGDVRDKVIQILQAEGYKTKRAGG